MHPCNNFGLWTVNKKLDECVTLHNNFLEMSYELNIKMKCLAPLHLGDVKNFLIPPRMGHFFLAAHPHQKNQQLQYAPPPPPPPPPPSQTLLGIIPFEY